MEDTKYSLIRDQNDEENSSRSEASSEAPFDRPSDVPVRKSMLFPILSVAIAVILIIGGILAPLIVVVTKANACSNKPPFPYPLQDIKWTPCPVITDPSVYSNSSSPAKSRRQSAHSISGISPLSDDFMARHIYNHPEYMKRSGLEMSLHAQCATVMVPLDWNPDSLSYCSTINVFVKRIYYSNGDTSDLAPKQVWWIPGGGGVPSSTLEGMISLILPSTRGLVDFFIYDKRGVGQSSFIECPDGSAASSDSDIFVTKCVSYAKSLRDRLKFNTFTNTAKDMSYLMQSVASSHKLKSKVYVIGSSQGSYLAQRLLHVVPPGVIDGGVILDSIFAPDITKVSRADEGLNSAMLMFFSRCSSDSFCTSMFSNLSKWQNNATNSGPAAPDLLTTATNIKLLSRFSPFDCLTQQVGMTYADFSKKLNFVFAPGQWQIIPALFYRLARCSPSDVDALRRFASVTKAPEQASMPGWSILVELNHDFSELWNSTRVPLLTCAQLRSIADTSFAASYVMPDIFCPNRDLSRGIIGYDTDQFFESYPSNVPPLLVMTSDLDNALLLGQARYATTKYRTLSKNAVTLVEFPNSGHTPSGASPVGFEGVQCGMQVMFSYILSDTRTPDTSCLSQINQIDFASATAESAQLARKMFNTENLWN